MTNKKPSRTEPHGLPFILRKKTVIEMVGLSASTIYNLQKKGAFPPPLKLSSRACGWLTSDIEHWLAARAAERAA